MNSLPCCLNGQHSLLWRLVWNSKQHCFEAFDICQHLWELSNIHVPLMCHFLSFHSNEKQWTDRPCAERVTFRLLSTNHQTTTTKTKKRGEAKSAIWYKLSWGTLGNSRHKYETFMIFRCNTTEQVFYVRNIHNTLQRQEEKVTERSTFLSKHTCCLITIAANVMIWNGMPQCHTTIPYPLTIWICQFKMGTWRKKHHTMMCEKQPYSLPMKMTNFAFFCNMLFQLKKTAQWFGSH